MTSIIKTDRTYSTTRQLTASPPIICCEVNDSFRTQLELKAGDKRFGSGGLRSLGQYKSGGHFDSNHEVAAIKPLITIITVVFNGASHIEQTILSVVNQTYENVEYIIIDGGSTDGTVEIIRKYEHLIDYWVSEPDNGLYNAMNKAIIVSTGRWIGILNADDYYKNSEVLEKVAESCNKASSLLVSNTILLASSGEEVTVKCSGKPPLYLQLPFMHPSLFVSNSAYKNVGLYNEKYRIAADVDIIFRLLDKLQPPLSLDLVTVCMRMGGVSDRKYLHARREYAMIYFRHKRSIFFSLFGFFVSCAWFYANKAKKFIRSSFG